MNVAIVGSRSWPEPDRVALFVGKLSEKYPEAVVFSGGARGVDILAEQTALECGLFVVSYRCTAGKTWRVERAPGKDVVAYMVEGGDYSASNSTEVAKALMRRNSWIVAPAARVVAFHDGDSSGTADSIAKAVELRKPTFVYRPGVAAPERREPETLFA